jgi:hypothetical protein
MQARRESENGCWGPFSETKKASNSPSEQVERAEGELQQAAAVGGLARTGGWRRRWIRAKALDL